MRIDRMQVFTAVLTFLVALASASFAHAATFTIGGTLSGLNSGASVTLLDNATDSLTLTANGTFTFATPLATGTTYKVTVGTQPTGQTCTVAAGSGTVGTKNVTTVKVTCIKTYTIGGTASGLITGRAVTLLDNGTNALRVAANGTFKFTKALASGAAYKVTISVQPAGETCTVTNGSGTVGTSNVTNVAVACTPNKYTIGGTVSGLSSGASVTLLDNGADALKVTANGAFTFATPVASGSPYKVTVSVQPTGETCTVTKGAGTVVAANITTVVVTCAVKTFTIGGTVSGLGSSLSVTLLDNGSDSLTVAANGAFTFAKKLATGATYNVTVGTQPTGETCTVTNGSGTVGTKNVTTVSVACVVKTFTIGGTLSGLGSGHSVTLLDNGSDSLALTANGTFTFATALPTGATYSVTVGTQPTGQTCTVTNGSGTVGTSNVTNVAVACTAPKTFSIGGTLSGLGSSLSVTLLDNGTDSLTRSVNGTFTFAKRLATGATYNVTVSVQPSGQTCTVTNGSGTVGTSNITNIAVACSGNGGGGGAYWIPYSASPVPQATPPGSNGLFLIPSDKLSTAPAPSFVTTDKTQLLGIGTQISESGGTLTYSPQLMMYADTNSSGTTSIFGLTLANTSTVPTPAQISNLVVPATQQVCSTGFSSLTDVTQPTTLFVVIEVGTPTQCSAGGGTYEVVHYTDSSTTAPVVVSINTTDIQSVFQNGKLTGLLLYASGTSSFNLYADNTFKSPTQKITGLSGVSYESGVLDAATLSTTGLFFEVTTTAAVNELYRIDGSTLAATLIQNLAAGSVGTVAQDDSNLYYLVLTPGASSTLVATINQVALTGGTPKLLYTAPTITNNGTAVSGYQMIGANDSVVVFYYYSEPFTNGFEDPTKAIATIYSIPVGTTTTTPTTLANYPAGNQLYEAFLSAPSGSGLSSRVLFATVRNAKGSILTPTIAYSAVSIPLNGGTAPAPIANSAYLALAIISAQLTDNVWQVTGITDTNGGFGGGTANSVNVSNLTDTPFTTTGGGDYVFSAGFNGAFFAISSNNIALGFLDNASAVISGGATLQEQGAAADLSTNFLYPVVLTNTYVMPY